MKKLYPLLLSALLALSLGSCSILSNSLSRHLAGIMLGSSIEKVIKVLGAPSLSSSSTLESGEILQTLVYKSEALRGGDKDLVLTFKDGKLIAKEEQQ